jgi:hypothetical protein
VPLGESALVKREEVLVLSLLIRAKPFNYQRGGTAAAAAAVRRRCGACACVSPHHDGESWCLATCDDSVMMTVTTERLTRFSAVVNMTIYNSKAVVLLF